MPVEVLLGIAIGAVALLLLLVIKLKVPAYLALLIVALGTALVTPIPLAETVPTLIEGMGKTLGSVMIIVGLGAMLGRAIEVARGAESLATFFTGKFGVKRVVSAVTVAAFVLGIPVFFDVGFLIFAPIIFGFALVAKINPLKIGLPVASVLIIVHVALPPHPGPVAAAEILGVDSGFMLIVALPLCAVTCVLGYLAVRKFKLEGIEMLDSPAARAVKANGAQPKIGSGAVVGVDPKAPSAGLVSVLILLPIALIMAGTVGTMLIAKESIANTVSGIIGSSSVALLIAVIFAYIVLSRQQGWNAQKRSEIFEGALPLVAIIVFVTGAGGVFANVLVKSGIGSALSNALIASNMPVILAAFVIAAALRISQGSATVAILTTAGLITAPVAAAGYTPLQACLVTIAMCFGAAGFSHVNDSGYWIVTRYLGLSVKDGLRTWTLYSTIFGVIGFLLTWATFGIVTATM
ncbi:GntP family transporter [Canibacter sp. lx-72]|nr:GntP family transporter [Canibacter zhuwentaonis]MBT1035484.1 GntP family transporter [Canibacter zhuwentaonis]